MINYWLICYFQILTNAHPFHVKMTGHVQTALVPISAPVVWDLAAIIVR